MFGYAPAPPAEVSTAWRDLRVGETTQCYCCHGPAKRAAGGQPSLCEEHQLLVRQLGDRERG